MKSPEESVWEGGETRADRNLVEFLMAKCLLSYVGAQTGRLVHPEEDPSS